MAGLAGVGVRMATPHAGCPGKASFASAVWAWRRRPSAGQCAPWCAYEGEQLWEYASAQQRSCRRRCAGVYSRSQACISA